jgi:hypothetical protein
MTTSIVIRNDARERNGVTLIYHAIDPRHTAAAARSVVEPTLLGSNRIAHRRRWSTRHEHASISHDGGAWAHVSAILSMHATRNLTSSIETSGSRDGPYRIEQLEGQRAPTIRHGVPTARLASCQGGCWVETNG